MYQMKESIPLFQKMDRNERKPTCKCVTMLSFVLILVGLGAYLSPAKPVQRIPVTATIESNDGMTLQYQTSSTYKGAVLEYDSVYHKSYYWYKNGGFDHEDLITSSDQAKYWQDQNIERITPYVQRASRQKVDILVLSEFALNGLVPTREEMFFYLEFVPDPHGDECTTDPTACTPCNNDAFSERTTLQQLSCLAIENNLNLVVNYGDYRDCEIGVDEDCVDGHYQWNTQIVFDYNGVIISKYYKIHTYKEDEYNVPFEEDPTTFTITLPSDEITTVTFGIVVCYDSIYGSPLLPLVKEGITDFVMSHWWVNTAPTMNIAMWTQAVSKTYGINLLAAANTWKNEGGSANVLTGDWYLRGFGARDSSGSGLYSQGSVMKDYYNQENEGNVGVLLAADMPIGITSNADDLPEMPEYIIANNEDSVNGSSNYCEKSKSIGQAEQLEKGFRNTFSGTLECDTGFSCTVSATISHVVKPLGTDTKPNYIWMYAFDGYYQTPDGGDIWYYENFCAIAVCDANCYFYGSQGDTTHVEFSAIEVSANINENATVFVLSGDNWAKAMDEDGFYETNVNATTGVMTVRKSRNATNKVLLNLSVMGRVYNKDTKVVEVEEDDDPDSSIVHTVNAYVFLWFIGIVLFI
eukprot:794826_1